MKRFFMMVLLTALGLTFGGCGATAGVRRVSSDEARQMLAAQTGYIVLDVRTHEEYASGHIPKAICVPNETIQRMPPPELPDMEQTIFVYCRSGRRSEDAAKKLANMGYKNIIDFGGILDWHGDIER